MEFQGAAVPVPQKWPNKCRKWLHLAERYLEVGVNFGRFHPFPFVFCDLYLIHFYTVIQVANVIIIICINML